MTKKTRIIFGLPSFATGGGIENQLLQQLHHYDLEKYEIRLMTLFYVTDRPHLYDRLPTGVSFEIFRFGGYFDVANYFRLFRAIRNFRPDIVITSMFPANTVFRIFKLFFRYKVITREHNTYTDKTSFHNVIERILSPLSDMIIAVSAGVADFFSEQAGIDRGRITVLNNGIDLVKVDTKRSSLDNRDAVKKELGFNGKKIVLNVARLKPQKNHILLLESFKIFSARHSGYELVILGIGSEKDNLFKAVREMGLTDKVHLLGYRDDVHKFYYISDMFVLTSRIEGFPNVLLEAMANSLPAVSTVVPGAGEVIDDGVNGFLCDSNPEEVAAKMAAIDENLIKLSSACRAKAEKFDIVGIVKRYEGIIDFLAKTRKKE